MTASVPPAGTGGHASTQLCEVCYQAAATLVCCSDEAALCDACDASVHTANGISVKHVRLAFSAAAGPPGGKAPPQKGSHSGREERLASPADRPPCDVCQQARALIHCRQERSYLCQSCDQSVHTASHVAAAHARFYLALVPVALLPIPDVAFTGRAAALRARQAAAEAAAAAAQVAKEQRSLNRMRAAAQGGAISGGGGGGGGMSGGGGRQPRSAGGKGAAGAEGDAAHEDRLSDSMLPGCGGAPPTDGQLLRNGSGGRFGGGEGEYDTGTSGPVAGGQWAQEGQNDGGAMRMGRIFSFSDLVLPSDVLDNSMGAAGAMEV